MPTNNDMSTLHSEKLSRNTLGTNSFASTTMAASKSGSTLSEAHTSTNANKTIENSLIKYQGQKWQQFFDFDKMLKQIRVAEKQHYRYKGDHSASNNGKSSSSSNIANLLSKSTTASSSKSGRTLRQVQRLCGNDMHYYGIVPKQTAADVIVCSICRGSYTMIGFNNHMLMQHPSAWGAASSKLTNTLTSNDMYSLLSNENSQDCIGDGLGASVPTESLGSPSDFSGIMSTSSNASSSSSSLSTASSTYAATPRHKSSKSGGTTAGSSSSGGSSTSGSRARSKQSRHSSSNSHATPVGIHTPSTASSENTQTPSKSSKKSSLSSTTNKHENTVNTMTLVMPALTTQAPSNNGSNSKDTSTVILDTAGAATPIALYSSSSNSSCSLPPTPKLCTTVAEAKSPSFVGQESVDSSVSSSSSEYERASSTGTALSSKSSHTAANASTVIATKKVNTNSAAASSAPVVVKEVAKSLTAKEADCFNTTQLSELDQAVSSITECTAPDSTRADKNVGGCIKDVIDPNTNMAAAVTNIFQIPTTNIVDNGEKLQQEISATPNMTVVALPSNYVVPQEVAQACEDALPHNTTDDNSILTFDDVFDSKFINEILNTADTEIHFDENELDTAATAQQLQQQHQQHQLYQQQQPSAKRMRYDETIMTCGQQQQQQQDGQSVEITGEFVAYQQQQQQQQQQYVPYNVASLDDLKMYNGSMVEQHQQLQTHLTHSVEQPQEQQQHLHQHHQQQQLTAIDALQLQQLLYQQQTLNTHYGNGLVDDPTEAATLGLQQQQFDQTGVANSKQLMDMCTAADMKSNKLDDFTTIATGYDNAYDNMASHFQLYNVPSLTDDAVSATADHIDSNGGAGILMPNLVSGMQRATQQYMLPGGAGEEHLIYEITDNNQVAVISQQRQHQMFTEFLTQANYEHVAADMNATPTLAATSSATALVTQNTNSSNMHMRETDDESFDLLDFDYSLLETVKTISSSGNSNSGSGANLKTIKTELNSSSKYYEDVYLNAYLYSGIPRPIAINCFGLIKLPFAAATTFRKHILNARKANNCPITLSGGGINGIVCSNSATAARLSSNSKSMPNYFSNLASSSNSLLGSEFSIGSITITNSSVSQTQMYAAQQKQQNAGSGIEITFNANSNGNGSAMSPVSSSMQRSRSKAGNSTTGGIGVAGGATLVRSKSQTGGVGMPVAVVTPTSRLPAPPRPSTAGPVLAQSTKTIFVSNTPANVNDRIKFIKRCAPLCNNNSRYDGNKRSRFSPRQIADFLGGVSSSSCNKVGNNLKSLVIQQSAEGGANGGTYNHDNVTNPDEQLKLERIARFYERRHKLCELARNTRPQQQSQPRQQRSQTPQMQQTLLKQQQQLFKMLTDYGQLNAAAGYCKSANVNPNNNSNNGSGSDILRITV